MNFTGYSQVLSSVQSDEFTGSVIDLMGQSLESEADTIRSIDNLLQPLPQDVLYDVMLLRFALSTIAEPFPYLNDLIQHITPGGYLILQDYVMPEEIQVADYLNGFIHLFDKNHRKSFAQYEWDGLVLDVGLHIKQRSKKSLDFTLTDWIHHYQPDTLSQQHAQIMLVQAPGNVVETMQIHYAGTSFAKFELQELICVAQKEL